MNNQEKAYMLMGQRVSAAKSYRDRNGWKRDRIVEARDLVIRLASPEAKMLWAEDPEVLQIIKGELSMKLSEAEGHMGSVVACLRGMLAGNRFGLADLRSIEGKVKTALSLVQEGKDD